MDPGLCIIRGYTHVYQENCELALQDQKKARELIGEWGSELLESCLIFILDQCNYTELRDTAIKRYLAKFNSTNYTDSMAMAFVFAPKETMKKAYAGIKLLLMRKPTGSTNSPWIMLTQKRC